MKCVKSVDYEGGRKLEATVEPVRTSWVLVSGVVLEVKNRTSFSFFFFGKMPFFLIFDIYCIFIEDL